MARHYGLGLLVQPLLVGPVAHLGTEATIIFGPQGLATEGAALELLADPQWGREFITPLLAQISRQNGKVLATTTIQSSVRAAQSRRLGQQLVVGLWIQERAFLLHERVLELGFDTLDQFISSAFGRSLGAGGADRVTALLQTPDLDLDNRFDDLRELLVAFESEFGAAYREPVGLASRLRLRAGLRTLLTQRLTKPARSFQEVRRYWAYLDSRIRAMVPDIRRLNT